MTDARQHPCAFTDAAIAKLHPPSSGQIVVHDDGSDTQRVPHLLLRVTPGGTKTFMLYRRVNGRPRRVKIGNAPSMTVKEARKRARELNVQVDKGETVGRTKLPDATLGQVFALYYEKRSKPRKKSHEQDQATYDAHLKRHANTRMRDIDVEWADRLHKRIAKSAPIAANRVLSLLSVLCNYWLRESKLAGRVLNPCRGVERSRERERNRRLTHEELPRFVAAIDRYEFEGGNADHADILRVLLRTGQRRGNVLAMRWDDLDLARGSWTIPGEHFKNGDPHVVSLSGPVVAMLSARRIRARSKYVFPGLRGSPHVRDIRVAWRRVLSLAGIDPKTIRIHDIRATYATMMAEERENINAIARQMGHKRIETTDRYVRMSQAAIRDAVDRTDAAIDRLLKESA